MQWVTKQIKRLFAARRDLFEEGGKLEKLGPFYEATETFFLYPVIPTRKKPVVRDSLDLKRFMSLVIVALLPPTVFGIWNAGYQSRLASGLSTDLLPAFMTGLYFVLPIILVSYAVGFFWETLFAAIRKHPISEGLLVTGLLYPLTLPPDMPLWQVAVGMSFGIVIGKEIFGGTGRNIFNPALTARAFVFFAYPAQMSGDAVWVAVRDKAGQTVDAVTGATPLSFTELAAPFNSIKELLQANGFNLSKLFLGYYPGTIGGTSALLCLLGAAFLIILGVANFRVIAGGIIGLLAMAGVLNLFAGPGALPWFGVNPIYHLASGGFAFGIAYMATDPVSGPGTNRARWIYGFLIGVLTILIRVFNPAFPEGVMLAILFMNLFAPLMETIEIRLKIAGRIPNV
ncbi:MAG: NADH:ubiquinone reductase (Na(+)-transporting) subunit B [Desulfobacterales bacterium]|nr:NADH:ubiquinone reductase (Na(+)-transporting) subunit B [Desulfobacterales bacterium]